MQLSAQHSAGCNFCFFSESNLSFCVCSCFLDCLECCFKDILIVCVFFLTKVKLMRLKETTQNLKFNETEKPYPLKIIFPGYLIYLILPRTTTISSFFFKPLWLTCTPTFRKKPNSPKLPDLRFLFLYPEIRILSIFESCKHIDNPLDRIVISQHLKVCVNH